MRTKYITESGSIWYIDTEAKTWERTKGPKANEIRSESGVYDHFEVMDTIYGRQIFMLCPPFVEGSDEPRVINSSPIVSEEPSLKPNRIEETI